MIANKLFIDKITEIYESQRIMHFWCYHKGWDMICVSIHTYINIDTKNSILFFFCYCICFNFHKMWNIIRRELNFINFNWVQSKCKPCQWQHRVVSFNASSLNKLSTKVFSIIENKLFHWKEIIVIYISYPNTNIIDTKNNVSY